MDRARRLLWGALVKRQLPGAEKALREVNFDASLSCSDWKRKRNERLAGFLEFSRKRIPFYRDSLSCLPSKISWKNAEEALLKAPFLTKADLRTNLTELMDGDAGKAVIFENATGGSTGKPVRFFQDRGYREISFALDTHVRSWSGVSPGERTALVWGADRDMADLPWRERLDWWASGVVGLNAFRMGPGEMEKFHEKVLRVGPCYMMGYATALEQFARFHLRKGGGPLRFRGIRSSAETLWRNQRELLKDAFDSPVLNFYGSREINNIAAECPEEGRLHLISTFKYLEIVDEKGNSLPSGKAGNIALTDMSNRAMPFIRYINDDVGTLDDRLCDCGRPSPVLRELLGRSTDLIRTPDGETIHGEFFTHLFYGREDIKAFQIHQTSLERLVVRIVPAGETPSGFLTELLARISAKMGRMVRTEIEICDAIPVLPSGKFRFTISDVKADGRKEELS